MAALLAGARKVGRCALPQRVPAPLAVHMLKGAQTIDSSVLLQQARADGTLLRPTWRWSRRDLLFCPSLSRRMSSDVGNTKKSVPRFGTLQFAEECRAIRDREMAELQKLAYEVPSFTSSRPLTPPPSISTDQVKNWAVVIGSIGVASGISWYYLAGSENKTWEKSPQGPKVAPTRQKSPDVPKIQGPNVGPQRQEQNGGHNKTA